MSINDLSNMDLLPVFCITGVLFIVIMIIAVYIGTNRAKMINTELYGENEVGTPEIEKNAVIISKTQEPHPQNQSVMVNYIVFELVDHNRIKFAIKDSDSFSLLEVGDCGTLKHINKKKFVEFKRNENE